MTLISFLFCNQLRESGWLQVLHMLLYRKQIMLGGIEDVGEKI